MSLIITSLNSGSNGNCYYIGNDKEAVLIDAGLSCRETERRMARLGLSMQTVQAIFVSHEHSDHIRGINILSKKYQTPIYITPKTLIFSRLNLSHSPVRTFKAFEAIKIGDLSITGFPKMHDASDPHSFIISHKEVKVGVFTDIGTPCEHVITHFRQCHAAILEANYDDELLEKSAYPYFLKQRIMGTQGHLSNSQSLALFKSHRPPFMTHLLLGHLSKNNNCPIQVKHLFNQHANGIEIVVASRDVETPLYRIKG